MKTKLNHVIVTERGDIPSVYNVGDRYTAIGNKHIFIGAERKLFNRVHDGATMQQPFFEDGLYYDITYNNKGYYPERLMVDHQRFHLILTDYGDMFNFGWIIECIAESDIYAVVTIHVPDFLSDYKDRVETLEYYFDEYQSREFYPKLRINVVVDHKDHWHVKCNNGTILAIEYDKENGLIFSTINIPEKETKENECNQ